MAIARNEKCVENVTPNFFTGTGINRVDYTADIVSTHTYVESMTLGHRGIESGYLERV